MDQVTIWKYPLQKTDLQTLKIPAGYKIISVQVQNGAPCLWAMVDPLRDEEKVFIRIFGAGHPIATDLRLTYIGTFQLVDGAFVGRVFQQGAA